MLNRERERERALGKIGGSCVRGQKLPIPFGRISGIGKDLNDPVLQGTSTSKLAGSIDPGVPNVHPNMF